MGTIQTSIDLLPATGAMVQLLDGTYNISSAITLDSYQTLKGCGRNTIFTASTADLDIIQCYGSSGSEKTGITIADLCVDGDAGGETNDYGIDFYYVDSSIIKNCWFLDNGKDGIYLEDCDGNIISNNICIGNTSEGISLAVSSYNTVSNNICQSNTRYGIAASGNNTKEYNNFQANICEGNKDGIWMGDTESNVFQSNICEGNAETGIIGTCGNHNCTLIGNHCQGNGYHGIAMQSSNNVLIEVNLCTENSQDATNTYSDILLSGVAYSLVQGNICRAGSLTNKPKYGIDVYDAGCDTVKVINNDLYDDGFGTAPYHNVGTDTIYVEPNSTVGSTFPTVPTDGMTFCHEVTGRKILYCYDLDNTTWVPVESIGSMTLYVDKTDGSDSLEDHGTGVDGDAFATVQYAIDCIPGLVGGNVVININNESYAETVDIQGKAFTGGYTIKIYGADFSNTALTIDAATQGTVNSVNYGTITDNGSAWGLRATLESGNADGIGAEASVLEDTGQNFLTTCKVGMSVKNTTDDTWAKIETVATDIRLTLDTDIMDDGEDYIIGWPEHKGKWITFASDTDTVALQSDTYLILENDSDTLTIVGRFDAVPAGADTAYISTLQTIISGKITIAAGQLGVNFYRLDIDATVFQITSEAFSDSAFYYCDVKSGQISGKALFTGCFIHKEDDTKSQNRIIYGESKYTQCRLTSCLLDGEGLHYDAATSVRGFDINNGAGAALTAPVSVIQNFTPKAGVTNYGVYMRVNAYFPMWHPGTDCHHWIRFCSVGLDAAVGAIGQYCISYTTYANNGTDRNVDAATFATVT